MKRVSVARVALLGAYEILLPLGDYDDELNHPEKVELIDRAFRSCRALKARTPEKIVAAALWAVLIRADIDEVQVGCIGSEALTAFAASANRHE